MSSESLRRILLIIAALGVAVGLGSLLLDAGAGKPDTTSDQAVERARERHARARQDEERARHEQAREAAARERARMENAARQAAGSSAGTTEEPSEPELGPDGLPDRGPPFDPHDLVLTGDPVYDRQTRNSAAHRLYDQGEYPAAVAMAREILADSAEDLRATLLVVRSACAMGDADLAREFFTRLPEAERHRVGSPCRESGIELVTEPDPGPSPEP